LTYATLTGALMFLLSDYYLYRVIINSIFLCCIPSDTGSFERLSTAQDIEISSLARLDGTRIRNGGWHKLNDLVRSRSGCPIPAKRVFCVPDDLAGRVFCAPVRFTGHEWSFSLCCSPHPRPHFAAPFEIPPIYIDCMYILRYSDFVFGAEEIGPRPLSSAPLAPQHPFPLPQPPRINTYAPFRINGNLHDLKSFLFTLLRTLSHSFAQSATQLPLNQLFAHSLLKTRGVGYLLSFQPFFSITSALCNPHRARFLRLIPSLPHYLITSFPLLHRPLRGTASRFPIACRFSHAMNLVCAPAPRHSPLPSSSHPLYSSGRNRL